MLCTETNKGDKREGNRWNNSARRVMFVGHKLALWHRQRNKCPKTTSFKIRLSITVAQGQRGLEHSPSTALEHSPAQHRHSLWVTSKTTNAAVRFQIQGTKRKRHLWQQTPSVTCNGLARAVLSFVGRQSWKSVSISHTPPWPLVTCWESHYPLREEGLAMI